ncbi:MAG: bifunctional sulfate adenylyltransferase/adenylylsulfate kinase [Caldilineaceae bacterium]|nr:bifunctional sulfate adenylyltransferase/adenylylsulfate kinase [Caldilineaceae bacterium]
MSTSATADTNLITPYGGKLVNLVVDPDQLDSMWAGAERLPSLRLTPRAACDLELLATGAFSPLDRFMGQADYVRVVHEMRLADGTLFPIPITLPVTPETLRGAPERVALRDSRNNLLATMAVEEVFRWDPVAEQRAVVGTDDARHPLVAEMASWGSLYVSGRLDVIALPKYYDFVHLRRTPAQVRRALAALGYPQVVAFQTRNPLHRVHEELAKRAMAQVGGSLLLHPVVGMTKPGDIDHYTRVQIYETVVNHYFERDRTVLSLLPLAMRMAGPREALWHAMIRRNYGATHFVVGRDHAGPGVDSRGQPFYAPGAAAQLVAAHAKEIGIQPLIFDELVYREDTGEYCEATAVPPAARIARLSGSDVREDYLANGKTLPEWFTRSETADILGRAHPPRSRQGFCIWLTGLSGAGKSTIAEILTVLLMERGRQVTLLDGDVVRTHLSKGLGFSREDRDTNILRIGFVASEIVRHHGAVVCAAVSPYRAARNRCRQLVGTDRFLEVYVATPLEICEARDVKGLYARARKGEITGFTGIDDPYEPPVDAELTLTTVGTTPEQEALAIVRLLEGRGFVPPGNGHWPGT